MKAPTTLLILAALTTPLAATTVYTQDFESSPLGQEWSGAGELAPTGGLGFFGFGAQHLFNGGTSATTLTLLGLPQHGSVTLTFHLALWDSIDLSGDRFVLTAGGVALYDSSTDFGNYFPTDNIGHGPGTHITAPFDAFASPDYGQSASFRDSARLATYTFPHGADSLTITWQFPNSQSAPDEAFGIDNVNVSVETVPEPGSALLLASAISLAIRRRRA